MLLQTVFYVYFFREAMAPEEIDNKSLGIDIVCRFTRNIVPLN